MKKGEVITLTDLTFGPEVLHSSIPVLVDFWAAWCGPCKAMAPAVAKLAEDYAGRIKVGKVDVERYAALADRFGVSGLPSFLLFAGGRVVGTVVGADRARLTKLAAAYLERKKV